VTGPLCRLRHNGPAHLGRFAIYLAGRDKYEDNILPSGLPIGSPEEALDRACGLYLNDPTAWDPTPDELTPILAQRIRPWFDHSYW